MKLLHERLKSGKMYLNITPGKNFLNITLERKSSVKSPGGQTLKVKWIPPAWLLSPPPPTGKRDEITPPARKIRNKEVRIKNGNINKSIKLVHWNLGSRYWENKREDLQHFVDELNPKLAYISEGNLFSGLIPPIKVHWRIFNKLLHILPYHGLQQTDTLREGLKKA